MPESSNLKKTIKQNQEALEALAESDLRSAKYAQALLDAIQRKTSEASTEEDIDPSTAHSIEADNSNQSIFAY